MSIYLLSFVSTSVPVGARAIFMSAPIPVVVALFSGGTEVRPCPVRYFRVVVDPRWPLAKGAAAETAHRDDECENYYQVFHYMLRYKKQLSKQMWSQIYHNKGENYMALIKFWRVLLTLKYEYRKQTAKIARRAYFDHRWCHGYYGATLQAGRRGLSWRSICQLAI